MSTPISAKLVAELRARTGAGMMDCKKALEETNGNIDEAVVNLRKKGIAKAEKRAGRSASEGQIVTLISPDNTSGAMIELNCETDFVARTDDFKAVATSIARHVAQDTSVNGLLIVGTEDAYLQNKWSQGSGTLGEVVKATSAKTGENVVLRRVVRFSTNGGTIGSYLHFNGKVGVITEIEGGSGNGVAQLAKSVSEHVAAGVPAVAVAVDKDGVDERLVERERAIYAEQAASSGKPANIVEKMVNGRLEKFFAEVTLLNQPWVRDEAKTIKQLVGEAGKGLTVKRFMRFQMGEE